MLTLIWFSISLKGFMGLPTPNFKIEGLSKLFEKKEIFCRTLMFKKKDLCRTRKYPEKKSFTGRICQKELFLQDEFIEK